MILTDADELRAALRLALEERDEARAEVERLREGTECHVARPGEGTYECRVERKCPACRLRHAEAEAEQLRSDLNVVDDDLTLAAKRWEAEAMRAHNLARTAAERQREACAEAVGGLRVIFGDEWNGAIKRAKAVVRATPLVTDTKADGGSP